ncbi:hypothetical protein ACWDWO_21235 [Actinopolymorpha singaporensis]
MAAGDEIVLDAIEEKHHGDDADQAKSQLQDSLQDVRHRFVSDLFLDSWAALRREPNTIEVLSLPGESGHGDACEPRVK